MRREGWAEGVTDPATIDFGPRQAAALLPYLVVDGQPLNPTGRTGRTGRDLGWWGENAAADPIVIAETTAGPRVLLIRRSDCGQWAIPGGMVDPGETAPATLVRELREETRVDLSGVIPEVLTRTYVDDPRNSDHAWVCSTAALFRVPVPLEAVGSDDATDARWFPFTSPDQLTEVITADGDQLYAAHLPLLRAAHERLAGDRPRPASEGLGEERFSFGLVSDVFAVLEAHGFPRGDHAHVGRAMGLLLDLAETYEGRNQHGPGVV